MKVGDIRYCHMCDGCPRHNRPFGSMHVRPCCDESGKPRKPLDEPTKGE